MKAKYICPNCGVPVLKARWELGYEYCVNPLCIKKLGKNKNNLYERPPMPEEMDELSPYDLDDVASLYGYEPED